MFLWHLTPHVPRVKCGDGFIKTCTMYKRKEGYSHFHPHNIFPSRLSPFTMQWLQLVTYKSYILQYLHHCTYCGTLCVYENWECSKVKKLLIKWHFPMYYVRYALYSAGCGSYTCMYIQCTLVCILSLLPFNLTKYVFEAPLILHLQLFKLNFV